VNLEPLAAQANNLLGNDAFLKALNDIREEARDGLCRVPATDIEAIRDYQARVAVVDEIRQRLKQTLASGTPKAAPGIA
jgi:hypothetical protein